MDDDARFRPPPEAMPVETPLELDAAWVAERAAKQAAAAKPPPEARAKLGGVIVALILIAVVVAAIVWIVES